MQCRNTDRQPLHASLQPRMDAHERHQPSPTCSGPLANPECLTQRGASRIVGPAINSGTDLWRAVVSIDACARPLGIADPLPRSRNNNAACHAVSCGDRNTSLQPCRRVLREHVQCTWEGAATAPPTPKGTQANKQYGMGGACRFPCQDLGRAETTRNTVTTWPATLAWRHLPTMHQGKRMPAWRREHPRTACSPPLGHGGGACFSARPATSPLSHNALRR